MKIPRQLSRWLILGIALVIVLVVLWVLGPNEPLYSGKRLGYWSNEFQSGSRRRAAAEQALRGVGSNSVPILLAVLLQRESPLHARLASIIHTLPKGLQKILALSRESDDLLHIRATALLVEIGAPATSKSLTVLRTALDDPCDPVRANTVVALGKTAPRSAEAPLAVEALEHATRDNAGAIRANAYFNLAKFASDFPNVAAILKRGFEDLDSYVRVSTTNGLAAASETSDTLSVPVHPIYGKTLKTVATDEHLTDLSTQSDGTAVREVLSGLLGAPGQAPVARVPRRTNLLIDGTELPWSGGGSNFGYLYFCLLGPPLPLWEFAPCSKSILTQVAPEDLATRFVSYSDRTNRSGLGQAVFGTNWMRHAIRVSQGQVVLARLARDHNNVYALEFANQTPTNAEIFYLKAPLTGQPTARPPGSPP